jgi:hypothetical protein
VPKRWSGSVAGLSPGSWKDGVMLVSFAYLAFVSLLKLSSIVQQASESGGLQ